MPPLRVISWNTANRKKRAQDQAGSLISRSPDLVTLQEVTHNTVNTLRESLKEGGLVHTSFSEPIEGPKSRSYGVLVASRFPFKPLSPLPLPWPEKVMSVIVSINDSTVELHTAHIPNGSNNGLIKIETLEGVYSGLAKESTIPRILTGDFNTPQAELPSGEVVTWAQKISSDGSVKMKKKLRWECMPADWDKGERRLLTDLSEFGIIDSFRSLHGYSVTGHSWVLKRKGEIKAQRRFDHILSSLRPLECRYIHEWRENKLSDHSPIEAVLDINHR